MNESNNKFLMKKKICGRLNIFQNVMKTTESNFVYNKIFNMINKCWAVCISLFEIYRIFYAIWYY